MYRYFLGFLLLSTYSGSLGIPLPENTNNGSLSLLLGSLASSCPNTFIKEQINAQIKACSIPASPYKKQQYGCMMFFDINKQLCDSNMTLPENSSNKINEYLDVEEVCNQAKNWSVTDVKELPGYKDKVEAVLKGKYCGKLCDVEDFVTSQDTNFFCKYYKWGSEVLSSADSSIKKDVVLSNSNPVIDQSVGGFPTRLSLDNQEGLQETKLPTGGNSIHVPETPNASGKLQVDVASSEAQTSPQVVENQAPDSLSDIEFPKPSKVPVSAAQESVIPSQISSNLAQESNKPGQMPINPSIELEKPNPVKPSQSPPQVQLADNPLKTPSLLPGSNGTQALQKPPKLHDDEGANENGDGQTPPKDNLDQTDDYQDSDENAGGTADNDNIIDDQIDPQLDPHPIIGTSNKQSASQSAEEKEFYQTTMADDDHFFPFFLTAVIMVVLLYVLYHNKSKVSKVVLGLIVEGRQPGRRRNSRGHAYKRLDTLEQAMSTSSTAPPSKIIY